MPNTWPPQKSPGKGDTNEAPSALDPYKPLPNISDEELVNMNRTRSAHPGMREFYPEPHGAKE